MDAGNYAQGAERQEENLDDTGQTLYHATSSKHGLTWVVWIVTTNLYWTTDTGQQPNTNGCVVAVEEMIFKLAGQLNSCRTSRLRSSLHYMR
jgi:hypothetical protein